LPRNAALIKVQVKKNNEDVGGKLVLVDLAGS
jgi:hypothetical protein